MFEFITVVYCDASSEWQISFQDPGTYTMESIINFHNHSLFFLCLIAIFVTWMLFKLIKNFEEVQNPYPVKFSHSKILEIVWTVVPAIILILIAVPSFTLLYTIEEFLNPEFTIKVVGHQWYWAYEFSDFCQSNFVVEDLKFDSYMISLEDLVIGQFRLLEVDNRVVVPSSTFIRFLITSADVLHSWAVPSLGIKVDACPGRLNQIVVFIQRKGVFYGQCSEICGINHGFMPIVVESVDRELFINWVNNKGW